MKPLILAYDLKWSECALAFARLGAWIVVNPHNGPGGAGDPDFSEWIALTRKCREAGGKVYGYVDLLQWRGSKASLRLKRDILREALVYSTQFGLRSFFFDDFQLKNHGDLLRQLPADSILNPGRRVVDLFWFCYVDFEREGVLGLPDYAAAPEGVVKTARIAQCTGNWRAVWSKGRGQKLTALALADRADYQSPPRFWKEWAELVAEERRRP